MNEMRLEEFSQKIFGIHPQHYRRLAREGHVPTPVKGKIPLLEASRDLLAYYRKQAERKGDTLEAEKTLKLSVERKLRELKLFIRSGQLIPVSDVPEMVRQRDNVMKRELHRFKKRLVPRLVGKDVRQMSEIIGKQVIETLDRISRLKKVWKK